jgi:tetratricopeptide (TPR) repeat protein
MSEGKVVKKILVLSANPKNVDGLRLDEEVRDIKEGLRLAKKRDSFVIERAEAVRPRDIRREIMDHKPNIVHFSGHGSGEDGLVFEDTNGNAKLVTSDGLSALFELSGDKFQVECVLLNACYSEVQAQAIVKHVDYVVGMNNSIGDRAAIEFAVGFYDALGRGESYRNAYREGRTAILLEGIPYGDIPVLLNKPEAINSKAVTIQTSVEAIEDQAFEQLRCGDYINAYESFDHIIKLQQNYINAYFHRGAVNYALGKEKDAIIDYNRAIQIDPKNYKAYSNRADARYRLGDDDGALSDFDKAININPNFAEAYFGRSQVLSSKQAIADLDTAIKLKPDYAEAHGNRAFNKSLLGEKEEAIKDYQEAANLFLEKKGNLEQYKLSLSAIASLSLG